MKHVPSWTVPQLRQSLCIKPLLADWNESPSGRGNPRRKRMLLKIDDNGIVRGTLNKAFNEVSKKDLCKNMIHFKCNPITNKATRSEEAGWRTRRGKHRDSNILNLERKERKTQRRDPNDLHDQLLRRSEYVQFEQDLNPNSQRYPDYNNLDDFLTILDPDHQPRNGRGRPRGTARTPPRRQGGQSSAAATRRRSPSPSRAISISTSPRTLQRRQGGQSSAAAARRRSPSPNRAMSKSASPFSPEPDAGSLFSSLFPDADFGMTSGSIPDFRSPSGSPLNFGEQNNQRQSSSKGKGKQTSSPRRRKQAQQAKKKKQAQQAASRQRLRIQDFNRRMREDVTDFDANMPVGRFTT